MNAYEQKIVDECIGEFDKLAADRGNLESHCEEIAARIIPSHRNLFSGRGVNRTKGEKRNQDIYDSTAANALTRFAAILDSLLTPRTQTWHRIMASDPVLNRDRQVRLWFEEVNRLLFKYRYAPKANFASQNQAVYRSLGAYGTGCLFIDKLAGSEPGLRYRNVHLGEIYFSENHQGLIDKAHRFFILNARQAMQQFGSNTPKKIQECEDKEKEFEFLHCVKPRSDYDPNMFGFKGMEYGSYYIAYGEKEFIEEEGYSSFPYGIPRFEQVAGEIYGRSPAMDVLPAVKTLNEQKKAVLKQGHRATDPILLLPDDGVLDAFSNRPGTHVTGGVTADGRPLVHPLAAGNIAVGKDLMDDERQDINNAFYVTLFQILVETPTMTATEVMERVKEKSFLLAPTIGRQQSEYLGPMIERELDILASIPNPRGRGSILPEMPPLLKEAAGEYRVEYESPLSRSQRAEEAVGLMRTLETVLPFVNITQDPSPLDLFDLEAALPEVAEIQGMPLRWVKSPEAIAKIREARAQMQERQMQVQEAPGAAALTKAVGQVTQGK